MRRSKEETAASRRRILKEAGRLYREKGFDGVGVAEIMEAAGMTHGGFYRHFPSKEALIAEAMGEAFIDRIAPLSPDAGGGGVELIRAYIELYLSKKHLERPGLGCPLAAVGSEAAHFGAPVSEVFSAGTERIIERIAGALGDGGDAHRSEALRLMATLVGAVVIARAAGARSDLGAEVVEAVRHDEISRLIKPG